MATIYLNSAFGFHLDGYEETVKEARPCPFILQGHIGGLGTIESPPVIDYAYFFYTWASQELSYPNGFIKDLFNTIPNPPAASTPSLAVEQIAHYDGMSMSWSDRLQSKFQTFFKAPDIPGVTDSNFGKRRYAQLAGINTGYTTPDTATLDITGPIDLRAICHSNQLGDG